MRAHHPWEIVLAIAGYMQGEGTLTPACLCSCSVGILTTIPFDSFFLGRKGKGCEIQKRCRGGGISSMTRLGLGWGCLDFGPFQCCFWAVEAWSIGLNQRLRGVGPHRGVLLLGLLLLLEQGVQMAAREPCPLIFNNNNNHHHHRRHHHHHHP